MAHRVEYMALGKLKAAKQNPKRHAEDIGTSITRFGYVEPIVIDPFSGSGTSFIAAEQTGRRCCAMELEPKYVQVAIERWQGFTGQKAVRS